jgi:hypothetical protein
MSVFYTYDGMVRRGVDKTMQFPTLFLNRRLAMGLAAISVAVAASTTALAGAQPTATLVCTNPVSHVSWQIRIDFARSRVDSNPASISEAKISWHDPTDGGNYTLDRKSGDLTVIVASSTGGYFLHDRCALRPLN